MFNPRNFFMDNKKLVPGFKGIGKFKGKRATEYTPEERVVINHFFTNDDSNVYCATDNMPSELWGLLMGQYARSGDTAKQRLINLFSEVSEKDKTGKVPSLKEVAQAITQGHDLTTLLSKHLHFAGRHVDKYGVKYGHASLRDSGTMRICFEGVSQRATKHLEAAREGAYQEQSTRALPFTVDNLGMPFEVRGTEFEKQFLAFGEKTSRLYDEILACAKEHLHKENVSLREEADALIRRETGVENSGLTDREWNSAVGAKAFDIARSLLPQYMTTSLGMTLTARRFQDMLTEWQSSEFEEMQVLGRAAQIESMKIMPTLMKHGNPSTFYQKLPEKRRQLNESFVPKFDASYQNTEINSTLIGSTPDLENLVLASILLNGSDSSRSLNELKEVVSHLSPAERKTIAQSQFEGKESYELVPKSMEVGTVTFERAYDIGAFRDSQRQRGDRQQFAPYTTFAYHMPKEITFLRGDLEKRFHEVARDARDLHDDLINSGFHSAAEYVPLMANLIRHVATKDPVQCFYEAKLRCQAAGADSYRTIALQEIHQVLETMPSFKGLVEFDDTPNYTLNRLPETTRMAIDRVKREK